MTVFPGSGISVFEPISLSFLVPLAADRALNFQANYLGQIHSSHLPWAESKQVLQSMWGLVLGPPSIKAHRCFNS